LRDYRALLDELVADAQDLWVGMRERDRTRYYAAVLACERSTERLKAFRTAFTHAVLARLDSRPSSDPLEG